MARQGYGDLRKENAELREAARSALNVLNELRAILLWQKDANIRSVTLEDVDGAITEIMAVGVVPEIVEIVS